MLIKALKEKYVSAHEIQKPVLRVEVSNQEQKLAELQGKRCRNILSGQMKQLTTNGKFSLNDAWKLKKKMFPRCCDSPFAVEDTNGNLVS